MLSFLWRVLTLRFLFRYWRSLPRWAKVILAPLIVIALGQVVLWLLGLLRVASDFSGFGFWGVLSVSVLAVAAGLFYWFDVPAKWERRVRDRNAADKQSRLDALPRRPVEVEDRQTLTADDVQKRLLTLLEAGELERAETLLRSVKGRFGGEPWWRAFERQIALRR